MTPSAQTDERRGITSTARNQLLARSDPLFGYYFAPVWGTIVLMARPRKAAVFLKSDFHREFESISLQRRVHCELAPHGFGAPVIGQQLALRGGGHFPLGTGILNFRFNVSCLTRMRPPVNYHQKHEGRAGATVVVRFARYETIP